MADFTKEQRVLAAVWWHDQHIDQATRADVQERFNNRFGIKAPQFRISKQWEFFLFSTGTVVKDSPRLRRPKSRTNKNKTEQVAKKIIFRVWHTPKDPLLYHEKGPEPGRVSANAHYNIVG